LTALEGIGFTEFKQAGVFNRLDRTNNRAAIYDVNTTDPYWLDPFAEAKSASL